MFCSLPWIEVGRGHSIEWHLQASLSYRSTPVFNLLQQVVAFLCAMHVRFGLCSSEHASLTSRKELRWVQRAWSCLQSAMQAFRTSGTGNVVSLRLELKHVFALGRLVILNVRLSVESL
jgi:hypothetical protein